MGRLTWASEILRPTDIPRTAHIHPHKGTPHPDSLPQSRTGDQSGALQIKSENPSVQSIICTGTVPFWVIFGFPHTMVTVRVTKEQSPEGGQVKHQHTIEQMTGIAGDTCAPTPPPSLLPRNQSCNEGQPRTGYGIDQ